MNPFWKIWLIEIEHCFSTRVKENESFGMIQRIFLFYKMYDSKNKFISFKKKDTKNWTFPFEKRIKELDPFLFDVTQRIDFFFANSRNGSLFIQKNVTHSDNSTLLNLFIWIKELHLLLCTTQRKEPFVLHDSKNWTFFSVTHGIASFCFNNMTRRIEPSLKIWPSRINWMNLLKNMTQRIELF